MRPEICLSVRSSALPAKHHLAKFLPETLNFFRIVCRAKRSAISCAREPVASRSDV